MKQVYMTIGLPFSGKSTLAKQYQKKGWQIIERDEILQKVINSSEFKKLAAEISDNLSSAQIFERKNQIAIRLLKKELQKIILESQNNKIFYDATNLQKDSRAGILNLNKKGVEITGIFLDIPFDEILKRAEKIYQKDERRGNFNEKALPALYKMKEMFEPPKISEGFNHLKIMEFKEKEALKEVKMK